MQKKVGFATVSLALLAAAHSISNTSNDLVYDNHQVHARLATLAAGYNLTEHDDFSRVFGVAASESNANEIIKRHPQKRPLVPVATVKLSRNTEDTLWVGNIEIGTPRRGRPRQQSKIIFDTGSELLWVTSHRAREPGFSNKYNPRRSSTSNNLKRPFEAQYATSSVQGSTYTDMVNVGGIKVKMTFGSVTKHKSFSSDMGDGILGLSPSPHPTHLKSHFFRAAKRKYSHFNPIAAFYFGTREPELHLGQVKKVYWDKIEYHPIVQISDSYIELWTIGGGDIIVGKEVVATGIRTIFDTGAGRIFGPPEAMKKFYQHIPDHQPYPEHEGQVEYRLPCKGLPKVSFRWNNGNLWTILPEHLAIGSGRWCSGAFVAETLSYDENPETLWMIGDPFTWGKYIVFDAKDRRVGVAEAK